MLSIPSSWDSSSLLYNLPGQEHKCHFSNISIEWQEEFAKQFFHIFFHMA